MAKLKIGALPNDKPVKTTVELPAPRIEILSRTQKSWRAKAVSLSRSRNLIAPMLARFMATDRGFANRRATYSPVPTKASFRQQLTKP